jgi:hypothetical protein
LIFVQINSLAFCASPEALNATIICGSAFAIHRYCNRRFHETLAYKKPMDVYQESIKLNQEKAKAS